jgi:hypothetical protein
MKTSLIADMHCTRIRRADIELHTVSGTCTFYQRSTAVERNPGPCAGARQLSHAYPRHASHEFVGALAAGAVDGGVEGDGLFRNSAAGAVGGAHCLSPAAGALLFEQTQPAFGGYQRAGVHADEAH